MNGCYCASVGVQGFGVLHSSPLYCNAKSFLVSHIVFRTRDFVSTISWKYISPSTTCSTVGSSLLCANKRSAGATSGMAFTIPLGATCGAGKLLICKNYLKKYT